MNCFIPNLQGVFSFRNPLKLTHNVNLLQVTTVSQFWCYLDLISLSSSIFFCCFTLFHIEIRDIWRRKKIAIDCSNKKPRKTNKIISFWVWLQEYICHRKLNRKTHIRFDVLFLFKCEICFFLHWNTFA